MAQESLIDSEKLTGTSQVWRQDGPLAFPVQLTGGEAIALHRRSAPSTYGVVPPAAIPSTASRAVRPRAPNASLAPSHSSSRPSLGRRSEASPPAMIPTTLPGSTQNVGGASEGGLYGNVQGFGWSNAAFVVNALDNLGGSDVIRSRGRTAQ